MPQIQPPSDIFWPWFHWLSSSERVSQRSRPIQILNRAGKTNASSEYGGGPTGLKDGKMINIIKHWIGPKLEFSLKNANQTLAGKLGPEVAGPFLGGRAWNLTYLGGYRYIYVYLYNLYIIYTHRWSGSEVFLLRTWLKRVGTCVKKPALGGDLDQH